MDIMNWELEHPHLTSAVSHTDLQTNSALEKGKLDRAPVLSEDKYTEKTLVGNWFERRVPYIIHPNIWKTSYNVAYKKHVNKTWNENEILKWNNKLKLEGLPRKILLDHKREYYNNMTTTYDLSYNILPKDLKGPKKRAYNTRQQKWIPEQELTKSFGSLTQFGLRDILNKEIHKNSEKEIAKCRFYTTYTEEIGTVVPVTVKRNTKFNRRVVDFNVPNLKDIKPKSLFELKFNGKQT